MTLQRLPKLVFRVHCAGASRQIPWTRKVQASRLLLHSLGPGLRSYGCMLPPDILHSMRDTY